MRNLQTLFSALIFAVADLIDFTGAIENVGGNLCNTEDDQVFVKELVKSVDATLFGFQDSIAAGEQRFMVGNTKNGLRRGLLKFMVDSEKRIFPSDAKIECTEVRLFVTQTDEERRMVQMPQINLHKVTSDWTTTNKINLQLNGLNGGSANTGDTTWRYSSYPSKEWKTQGGDFDKKTLAKKISAGDLHWYGKTRSMAEVVQGWIDDDSTNYGFMLVGSDENVFVPRGSYSRYNGVESSPELIPRLIVTYTSPSQGKLHRTYNDYTDETQDTDIGRYIIGAVVGATVASIVSIYLRSRAQRKSDETNMNPDFM